MRGVQYRVSVDDHRWNRVGRTGIRRGAESMTSIESRLFAPSGADKEFGRRYNGRYWMPCLPGEETVKSLPKGAAPWVPRGVMSVTKMIDGFEESRGLNIWEQELALIGMALQPSLFGEL